MASKAKIRSKYDILPPDLWNYYKTHPVEFVEDMILAPNSVKRGKELFLSNQQKEALQAAVAHKRIAISSGRGNGKSATDSYIAIWFTSCFDEAQVVLTSPSAKQLKSGLWKEITLWINGSNLKDLYEITSERIYINEQIPSGSYGSFIEKRTASKENPEALSGIHAEYLFIIIDEASRVNDDNIRALVNTLTSGDWNKVIMTSNPTRTTGYYFESMNEDRAGLWKKLFWSALDSPFVSRDQILDMEMRYGKDHPIYKVDVLGQFCDIGEDTFFDHDAVMNAFDRDITPKQADVIEIGVDVARFGSDNTVMFWRQGYKVYKPIVLSKSSITDTDIAVKTLVTKIRNKTGYKDKIRVKVDGGGLGCLTENTLIATPDGWVKARDIKVGDNVLSKRHDGTLSVETVVKNNKRELTRVIRINDEVEFASHHILPYRTRKEYRYKNEFWHIASNKSRIDFDTSHSGIDRQTVSITFDEYKVPLPNGGFSTVRESVTPCPIRFARFLGWYLSEGSQCKRAISVTQVKEDNFDDIIYSMGFLGSRVCKSGNSFKIKDKPLKKWLSDNCYTGDEKSKAWNKKVPDFINNNSVDVIKEFLDAFRRGDGHITKQGTSAYTSTSKKMLEEIQILEFICGNTSRMYLKQVEGSVSSICGRKITRKRSAWTLECHKNIAYGIKPVDRSEREEHVYDISITGETHLFLNKMSDYSRMFWTHNGGLVDLLALDRLHNMEIIECQFGARGDDRHQNEVSLMYSRLRDVMPLISLPNEAEMENIHNYKNLREELLTRGVRYDTGKVALEQKSEYKRRIGRSPDLADALALCFFNKKTVRTFIKDFDSQSKDLILEQPNCLGGLEHYVSVNYSSTRLCSTVWAYWGAGTLYVIGESIIDDNIARVASEIRAKSPVKPIKIIGNHRCFGSPSEDIRAQIRRQGISLRENMRYDELGAIELLNYLVSNRNVKILKRCENTIRQMDRWTVDLKTKELEEDYGLCYAILNVVSELKDKIKPAVKIRKEYTPYSGGSNADNTITVHARALLW